MHSWLSTALWAFLCFASIVLCAEDYYSILNIPKSATTKEIQKAYRKLTKEFHPDKAPDDKEATERFVAIGEAYSTLSDPQLRDIYDRYGHEGIKQHSQSGGRAPPQDPFDLWAQFFGGGGGGRKRGPNREAYLEVPLAEFYTGSVVTFTLPKQVICTTCSGTGNKDKKIHKCPHCNGEGVRIQQIQLAPGMVQRVRTQCPGCGGSGRRVVHPCAACGGQRVVADHEEHTIHIEPGMPFGYVVRLENEADESPDWEPGDLYIKIGHKAPSEKDKKKGQTFQRRGDDLVWREVLSLREAWMGDWSRELPHLDGHTVGLGRKRGTVVQPGTVEVVKGEGMPLWAGDGPGHGHGDLIVQYEVVLPAKMESGMEKEFWSIWEKWRKKLGPNMDDETRKTWEGVRDEL